MFKSINATRKLIYRMYNRKNFQYVRKRITKVRSDQERRCGTYYILKFIKTYSIL